MTEIPALRSLKKKIAERKLNEALAEVLNALESEGQNPTAIRRQPDRKGDHWVIAVRSNNCAVRYDFDRKRWIVVRNLDDKFEPEQGIEDSEGK